ERKQEFFKRTNAAIRKRDAVALADLMANTSSDRLRGMIERRETIPAYALSNNSANIRRLRERLAKVEALQTMTERPERRIGDVVVRDNLEFQKVELHFPGKPDESLRRDLKRWGFRWVRSAGCWSRGIGSVTEARLEMLAERLGQEITSAGPVGQEQS